MKHANPFFSRLLLAALVAATVPASTLAEYPKVGGHVGLATPLVTIPSEGDTVDIGISSPSWLPSASR
jgi:hypothetical protein